MGKNGGGGGPARGTAAATASMRRRKATNGNNSGGAAASSMLQFYTRAAPGFQVSPKVVIGASIGFIACVVMLHVMSKFYLVR